MKGACGVPARGALCAVRAVACLQEARDRFMCARDRFERAGSEHVRKSERDRRVPFEVGGIAATSRGARGRAAALDLRRRAAEYILRLERRVF